MAFPIPVIKSVAEDNLKLAKLIKSKIDHKFKPVGALGELEQLALQLGLIQRSDVVSLQNPQVLIFAADHGVAQADVTATPPDMTGRRIRNILNGGAAVNVFTRQHGFELTVVDAGLKETLPEHPNLLDCKIHRGTMNFAVGSAMTRQQCDLALKTGADILRSKPGNVVALGEVASGASPSASTLLTRLSSVSIAEATDRGTGHENTYVQAKRAVMLEASMKFRKITAPMDVLMHFGGYETAMMVGAMLQAAHERRVILVDGFNACAAALVAKALAPQSVGYMVFSHQTGEARQQHMMAALGGKPLLQLNLSLGEGVGALLAWPLVHSAAKFLNEMASAEA